MLGMHRKFCGVVRILPKAGKGGLVALSSTVSLRCGHALVRRHVIREIRRCGLHLCQEDVATSSNDRFQTLRAL